MSDLMNLGLTAPDRTSATTTDRACRICNLALPVGAEYCGKCGSANPTDGLVKCAKCGESFSVDFAYCTRCGEKNPLGSDASIPVGFAPSSSTAQPLDFSRYPSLSIYYQEEFRRIHDNSPRYDGKWNWAAFFWGALWALTKGLWVPALATFFIAVVSIPSGGFPVIALWIYFGARGNSMYYKKVVLGEPWAFW